MFATSFFFLPLKFLPLTKVAVSEWSKPSLVLIEPPWHPSFLFARYRTGHPADRYFFISCDNHSNFPLFLPPFSSLPSCRTNTEFLSNYGCPHRTHKIRVFDRANEGNNIENIRKAIDRSWEFNSLLTHRSVTHDAAEDYQSAMSILNDSAHSCRIFFV